MWWHIYIFIIAWVLYPFLCFSIYILHNFQELDQKRQTLYFRDGKRKIDFILAYQDTEDGKKVYKRSLFEQNLRKEGLELEQEDKKVHCEILIVVK